MKLWPFTDFAKVLFRERKKSPVGAASDVWTITDQHAALQQGWGLFESSTGPQLQAWFEDELERFQSDLAAWKHVHELAEWGDPLAAKALDYLAQEAPDEYRLIVNTVMRRAA